MIVRRLIPLAFALAASGCATAPPVWRELTSPHFVLSTNVAEPDARALQAEFERSYQLLRNIAFPGWPEPPGAIHVLLFDDENDYTALGPKGSSGFFRASGFDVVDQPTIVMAAEAGYSASFARTQLIFLHELTHRFVRNAIPQAPLWLNEGMAVYLSSLEEDRAEHQVIVGKHASVTYLTDWAPLAEVLSGDSASFLRPSTANDRSSYGAAWGLVHFLLHQPGERAHFDCLLTKLRAGDAAARAWSACLGSRTAEQLDAALRAYFEAAPSPGRRAPSLPWLPLAALRERVMDRSEPLMLRATLRDWDEPAARERAKQELAAAHALAPKSSEVYFYWGRMRQHERVFADAEEAFRRALAIRPAEGRYWHALAETQSNSAIVRRALTSELPRIEPAVARMLALPCAAESLDFAANVRAWAERIPEALELADRAVATGPACATCRVTRAKLLHHQGQSALAVEELDRAIGLFPDGGIPSAVLDLRRRWRK